MTQKNTITITNYPTFTGKAGYYRNLAMACLYFILAIFVSIPTSFAASTTGTNAVTGYNISNKNHNTHFIINFLHTPDYKISLMQNPERIVIDLRNTVLKEPEITLDNNKLIKNIRHNLKASHDLRLVLDLTEPFIIKNYFTLPPKNGLHRLLIDIQPQNIFETAPQPELKPLDELPPPVPKLKKIRKPLISIDAGHGGRDPGTTGYHGSKEKKITLAFAYILKEALEDSGKYKVLLTRKNDKYIDLKKRVEISRNAKADMFISVHADAHSNRSMRGLSIYTLSEKASDKEAEALAQKENNAGVLDNVDTSDETEDVTALLIDLVQRESKNLSADLAENIIKEARTETEVLHRNPHRFAGFRVLTAPDIPSVLIELGYLSNRKEEKLLLSTKHKKKLAEAIVKAIDRHFRKYPVN